jgi:sec-independent protein translocase protein TatB
MFGLGMGEILLIAVVALLAVGPDRLPQAARSIGRGIRDLRRQTSDLQQVLEQDSQIGDAVRELRSAWYGTAGSLPKNRHELGRALDQMTQESPSPVAGEVKTSEAEPASDAEPAPAQALAEPVAEQPAAEQPADLDDGLPPIKSPAGTIARGGASDVARAPADPEPEDAPVDPPKPAHG